MNVWANAVLTDQGRALLAKLTQGNTLDITRAVTGAGFVTPGLISKQTEVTTPKQTLTLKPVSYPEVGKCKFPVALTNKGVAAGYKVTQVGVFASDPDDGEILFLIVQSTDADSGTLVPNETEMPGFSAEWTFYFQYGQADGVNVTVDPSYTVSQVEMAEYVTTYVTTYVSEYVNENAVSPDEFEGYMDANLRSITKEQIVALFGK